MTSSEDRQFFEELNQDLAKAVTNAISDGFDSGMGNLQKAIENMGKGVTEAVEREKKGDGEEQPQALGNSRLQRLQRAIGGLSKAAAALKAIGKPLEGAGKGIIGFGNTMARTVAQTGNLSLINARMVKDAAGNFKDLKFGEMSESITKSFGKYGLDFGKTGAILDTALRNNADVNDKGSQEFLARAVGLGNNLGLATQAIATNTNFLGMSTDASTEFNESMIDTAQQNNRVADVIMRAVEAFKENTRAQKNVFGVQFSDTMRDVVANIQGAMPDSGLLQVIGKLTGSSFQRQMAMRVLGSRVGVSAEELQTDPQRALAKIFKGVESDLARFTDPLQRAAQIEIMAGQSNLTTQDIDAILTQSQGKTTAELENILRGDKLTPEEREKRKRAEQAIATGISEDAATAMKDFRLSIAGADNAFGIMSEAADFAREGLYEFGDAAAQVAGDLAGISTGIGSAGRSTGVTGAMGSLGSVVSFAADIAMMRSGFRGLGRTFGKAKGWFGRGRGTQLLARGPQTAQGAQAVVRGTQTAQGAQRVSRMDRVKNVFGAQGMGGPKVRQGGIGQPFTAKGRALMANRYGASGGLKTAAKGMSKKIPLLGAAIAGGLELAETGDKSRAAAAATGGGLGTAGGMAAGAAIGTMIFPGVGTVIGGFLGALGGGWLGEKGAKAVHDQFDPEFVAKQEAEKQQQMREEAEAMRFEGTPEELRREAKLMAIQQAQLDEQTKQNDTLAVLVQAMSDAPLGPGWGPGVHENVSTFNTEEARDTFLNRYDDAWEQLTFMEEYNIEYGHAKRQAKREQRGGNN